MPLRRPIRAVLIDLDGTLIDRDAALREWLRTHGLRSKLAGPGIERRSLARVAREILALDPGFAGGPAALEQRMRSELVRLILPDELILDALDRLARADLRLALVSNGGGSTQRAKLAAAAIETGRFACISISAELGVAKPDARIFTDTLARLAVGPEAAIMIGDSFAHDVVGAAAAGIASCWITRSRSRPSATRARPEAIVRSFPAAVAWLVGHE